MPRKNYLITFLLLLASCGAALGQAQSQYDKGTPPQLAAGVSSAGSYVSTELGTVNLSNGGLNFNIPLGTVGGRGNVALPLTLSYSSKVWSASMDVDTERESGTEQSVAYADYDMGSSLGGGPLVPGWTLGTGMQLSSTLVRIKRIVNGPNAGCFTYGLHKLTLRLPDKGEIEFRDDATDGAPLLLNCQTQQTASRGTRWHATDGSGTIFINDVENGVGLFPFPNLSGTIIFADGTRLGSTTNGALVDRNGNRLSYTSNGFFDQLGRNITIQANVTDPDNAGVTLAFLITIPGYQGTPRYYKLKTGVMNQHFRSDINPTLPVINGDWDPEGWGYNWGTATRLFAKSYGLYAQRIDDRDVLTEVVLPDGRWLQFKYNEFGEVAEVELPTGAKIRYDYGYSSSMPSGNSPLWETGTNGNGAGIATDVKWVDRAVQAKRTYPDGVNLEGTWTFGYGSQSIGGVNYPCTTVTVNSSTSALLSKQRHIFLQGGRYTEAYNSQSLHDGTHYTLWSTGVEWRTETLDAAGNVLAATEQDWTQRAPVSWSSYPQEQPSNDNRVNQTRRYLETGMMAKVETFYDQYNNPIEVKEYDYDQTLKRRTVTAYLSTHNGVNYQTDDAIHLLRLPESQTIFDGSGNQVAKTVTEYDVYADDGNRGLLLSYASVSQHDSNYGAHKVTRGNPTRIGAWLNTTGTFIYTYPRYDILGNVVALKDARGNISTISFADDFGNGSNPGSGAQNPATPTYALPTLITSPAPAPGAPVHTARSQYDYSTGLLTGFRDRNDVVTQTIYNDPFNRPTLVKAALGISGIESHAAMYYAPATTPYGITLANSDVLTARDQSTLDDANLRSWTVTDGFGRTREAWTRDPQGNIKIATTYDALSRTKQVSNPFRLGETADYSETSYDLLGRVVAVTTPDGAVVSTAYSANTVTVTDQAAKKRKSVTDALGRLKEVYEDPNGWNYLTSYSYDTLDNLITVSQGSQTRTFSYNSLKQLSSATNPESGTSTYKYDEAGNLVVKTDARGVSTHYAYDAFNRVTRRWYNGSSATNQTTHNDPALPGDVGTSNEANYFYDAQALPQGAPSFTRGAANGRLVAVTYGTNSSNGDYLGYDTAGRNVLKIQRTGNVDYQTSATLNIASAPTAMIYPSGRVVNYSYDVAGRTSSITGTLGDGATRNYATDLSYSVWGGLSKEKFGTSNAVYHKLHYNVRGQLFDVRASNVNDEWGGELGALATYYSSNLVHGGSGADNNGNVLQSQTIINSFFIEDRYTYDALNRLTSVSEFTNGTDNTGVQEYDYDRYGNRTIKPASWGTGINTKQFTVNAANNRLGVPAGQSGVMSYDAAGNLQHDTYTGAGNRTYDADNKITSAWGGDNQAQLYGYDANGQRIKRTVDGVETWQVYGLGGELLAEYPANGAASGPQKEYCYRNGQLLVTAEPPPSQPLAPPSSPANVNVAAAGNGAVATASSTLSPFVASNANNGDHVGSTGHWADDTSNAYPDWIQVEFAGLKTIGEINVFGLQQNYSSPVEPTLALTSTYALTNFELQYWTGNAWATVPGGSVTGNNRVWCKFSFAPLTTSKIRVHVTSVAGDNRSQVVEIEAYGPRNLASAANGAVATASSTLNPFVASNVVNGDRLGSAMWADDTSNVYPDWIQVEFAGSKTISEIDVFGLQQNYSSPVEPTLTLTSSYALTNFEVQYWDGSAWATVPDGSVTGNNKVWRKFTFPALSTSKIRIHVSNVAGDNRSQVVELEAYGPPNVALAAHGAVATASSTLSTFVAGNANNGDHVGSAAWADDTSYAYPDWIQVEFAGSKTIGEIDVYGLQQNYGSPVEPTATMTSTYALTNFEVQYWTGSAWTTVPGGTVTGNDKVWRKFTFAPLTTSKIRVHVTNVAGDNRSQVVEIEAYAPANEAVVQWLVPDHLGTPRMIIDKTGTLANIKRHDYLPFGEELFAPAGGRTTTLGYATGDDIRQQFTLYERDLETGLDFAEARYYSSTQGRYTRPDPYNILFEMKAGRNARERAQILRAYLSEPRNWNRYSYVLNDPLNLIDPSGLIWLTKDDHNYIWIDDDEYKKNKDNYKDYSVANGAVTQYQGSSDCPQCQGLKKGDWVQLNENGGIDPVADPTTNVYGQPNDPPFSAGYTDINFSYGSPYFVGLTGGAMFGRDGGVYPYFGAGLVTPGPGSTVTYSPDSVSGGLNFELQGAYGVAGSVGVDEQGNSFTSVGGGSPGASATAYYVFLAPHPKGPHRPNNNCACNRPSREAKRPPSRNDGRSW